MGASAAAEDMKTMFTNEDFAKLEFLEGRWVGTAPDGNAFYEEYDFPEEGIMRSRRAADKSYSSYSDGSTVKLEDGAIISRWGEFEWRATSISEYAVHFEPVSAPSAFSWTANSADEISVVQEWTDEKGQPQRYAISLDRVEWTLAMYDDYLVELQERAAAPGEAGCAAEQLLALWDAARARPDCVFLELGTDRGQSTKAILNALEGSNGLLVSVDISDCSAAGQGDNWTFVHCNSLDSDTVFKAAPRLRDGIDCLYIDSLHEDQHVLKELYTYYPYIKQGGQIFFDDIDSAPYMRGRRKDSVALEVANRKILRLVRDVFYDNLDQLRLEIRYGSTGLATLTKMSPVGTSLRPRTRLVRERQFIALWRWLYKFSRKQAYVSRGDGSDTLIKPKG
jgi:predicted O-methyltransferase YrrM